MWPLFQPKKPSPNQVEIDRLFRSLKTYDPISDEYAEVLDRMFKLVKIEYPPVKPGPKLSPDVMLTAFSNLAGIWMIIRYEQLNVITTKALSFIRLGR